MANNIQLMEHQISQFGAVTVMDVLLRDPQSKEPILYLDTLKVSSINMEGETKEIRGGIGAPTLIEYDYGRMVNFEMQDALASVSSLALMWGGEYAPAAKNELHVMNITTGASGVLPDFDFNITEGEDGRKLAWAYLSATKEPAYLKKAGAVVTAYKEDTMTTPYEAGVALFVIVEGEAAATGSQVTIDNLSLPPTVELIGKTFFIERVSGKQMAYQINIPMLKINMGGGLTLEAEGDAAVFDFAGKALLDPITKEFFTLTRLGSEFKAVK